MGESVEALQEDLEALIKQNDLLRSEAQLFEDFLRRNAPHLLPSTNGDHSGSDDAPPQEIRRGGPQKVRIQAAISPDQKFFIATRELEAIRDEIERVQVEGEKEVEQLQSLREETETHISEIKREAFEFRRDIVAGAVNPRTGTIMAERVEQYYEGKIKAKDVQIEKLKLKNLSLKNQCLKLEAQLQHKEEMGEVFLPIDFDQLKIENQQYIEKIDERNNELLKLKVVAGNTVLVLNNNKKKLNKLTTEHDWLTKEISQREELLDKINRETERVDGDVYKARGTNRKLKHQNDEYRVPEVLDYVTMKAQIYDVSKKLKDWERKVSIAEMTLKKERTMATQALRESGQPKSSPNSARYMSTSGRVFSTVSRPTSG